MDRLLLGLLVFFLPCITGLSYEIHEKREVPLTEALDRQRIESDALLPMKIALRQDDNAILESETWLMAVSDPQSAQYGM